MAALCAYFPFPFILSEYAYAVRYVKVLAPAKVNLALRVGAARADGFHPLDTVFEALDIYEELEAWADPSGALSLEFAAGGLGADLPVDESNLAMRAALALRSKGSEMLQEGRARQSEGKISALAPESNEAFACKCSGSLYAGVPGARMRITKRIPIAGGMAGGSADAAAALVALNSLWELGFTAAELAEIGSELGSDVPFALLGGIARGTSRGEILEPVPSGDGAARRAFVMLTNPEGLSTPAVFREFDRLAQLDQPDNSRSCSPHAPATISPNAGHASCGAEATVQFAGDGGQQYPASTDRLVRAIMQGDHTGIAANMVNDLEAPAFSLRPDLGEIVAQLRADGVGQAVILSGSGPTIAVMCDPSAVDQLADQLRQQFPQLAAVTALGAAHGARVIASA